MIKPHGKDTPIQKAHSTEDAAERTADRASGRHADRVLEDHRCPVRGEMAGGEARGHGKLCRPSPD